MSRIYTITVILLICLIHALSLFLYPLPFCDEFWFLARTLGFLQTGSPFGELDKGVFDQIPGYENFFSIIPHIFYAPFVQFLGPTQISMRIVTLLFGLYSFLIVFLIFRKVLDEKVALFGACLFSLSLPFFVSGHLARLDIMAVAFTLTSTWLLLGEGKIKFASGFFSGLFLVLGYDCHPHSTVLIPPMFILVFFKIKDREDFFRRLIFCTCGLLFGAGLFYAWHIYPNPEGFRKLASIAFAPSHLPPIFTFNLSVVSEAFTLMPLVFFRLFSFAWELLLFLVGCILLSNKEGRKIFFVSLISILSYTLLVRHKLNSYYFIYFAPFLFLAVAKAFELAFKSRDQFQSLVTPVLIVSTIFFSVVIQIYSLVLGFSWEGYLGYQNSIAILSREINKDDVILAPQTFWNPQLNVSYYSWESLVYYKRVFPDKRLIDAFEKFRPTLLIIDTHFRDRIISKFEAPTLSPYLKVSKEDLSEFIQQHATTSTRIYSAFDSGGIDIIRLKW